MTDLTAAPPSTSRPGGPPSFVVPRRSWQALAVLLAGMFIALLDTTIVNVALPKIQSDLGFSQSSLAWVVNAYLISFGGLLLLGNFIVDWPAPVVGEHPAEHLPVPAIVLTLTPKPGAAVTSSNTETACSTVTTGW